MYAGLTRTIIFPSKVVQRGNGCLSSGGVETVRKFQEMLGEKVRMRGVGV